MNTRSFAKILLLIFGLIGFVERSFSQSSKTVFLSDVAVSPSQLEWLRDSVFFSIKGSIPIISGFLPRNPRLKLIFKSTDHVLDLGEVELKKNLSVYLYDQKLKFRYQPWMVEGWLEAQFIQGSKKANVPNESKILTKGISVIPLLMHFGLENSSLTNPEVGWMITKNQNQIQSLNSADYYFGFDAGDAILSSTSANQNSLNDLRAFVRQNPLIVSLKITGLQSPELSEGRNSKLGMDRALAVLESLKAIDLKFKEEVLVVDSRWRDWFDFRVLLRNQADLSEFQKEKYYTILQNSSDFLSQNQNLIKIPGFDVVSKRIYPLLRSAKVEIQAKQVWGLDVDKVVKMKEILSNPQLANSLVEAEWEIASKSADRIEDKETILRKMLIFFDSNYAPNNLAVLLMRQAYEEADSSKKKSKYVEAENLLLEAEKAEINPYIRYNQALLLLARGEEWQAYRKLSVASSQSKEMTFLIQNENLKGALDVWRGDYQLARIRYDYPTSDPKILFNKGIVFFLAKAYEEAIKAFEGSVLSNRDFGYGFYGLALVAATMGQEDIAWVHLQKAILGEESIRQLAKFEPVFEQVRNNNATYFGQ